MFAIRSLRKSLPLLACMLTFIGAVGCGDACSSLTSLICKCSPDEASCNRRAKDNRANFPVGSDDIKFCQARLDSKECKCDSLAPEDRLNFINSPAGRAACGLDLP